jgi:hypothetical protein
MAIERKGEQSVRNASKDGTFALLKVSVLTCALLLPTLGESQQSQPPSNGTAQSALPSMPHMYWHFLVYQNHLDTVAAAQAAQGNDASFLRNHFQLKLGFSDAGFAPIRTSSARLTAEVQALDAEAAAIRAAGQSPTSTAQLKALAAAREADINAEVAFLQQTLSPAQVTAFEAFLTQLFSTKSIVQLRNPAAGQPTSTGVQ